MLRITGVRASRLDGRLAKVFAISSASQTEVASVLVRLRLSDGSVGWGECAPLRPFTAETQSANLAAVARVAPALKKIPAEDYLRVSDHLAKDLPTRPSVRAGVEMALLDALGKRWRLPLYRFFGGRECRLKTDVTISVGTPAQAAADALDIKRMGIRALKVKIGRDLDEDLERLVAIRKVVPRGPLIVDANQGYRAAGALKLIRALRRRGIVPDLLEQPVPRDDLRGMAELTRKAGVPVCADESAMTVEQVVRLHERRAAHVVNIKIMKSGVLGGKRIAEVARALGFRLMVGGMVETRLAMTCSAHLAAGLGGFSFIDLDTPFFFERDLMTGPGLGPDGVYRLDRVRAGIGVRPRSA